MKREMWIILLFAALYIATFGMFQYRYSQAMRKAEDADAMVKLMMLDQRMYRHQFAVRDLGRALQRMEMIDSAQYNRMWRCIDDTRIFVLDAGVLQDALPVGMDERRFDVEMPWHEIMESSMDFQY